MSLLPKDSIKIIGESIGITNLSDEIASSMAPDVEYRLREIVQEAIKFMRHSKRQKLGCEDVNNALRLRNLEPLYGYSTKSPQPFVRATGAKDLFFIEDREMEFNEIINGPLPKCPRDSTLTAHWLAVEGVQPAIPQNPSVPVDEDSLSADKKRKIATPSTPSASGTAPSPGKVKVKPLVKHVISQELQVYYDKITAAFKGTDQELIDGALQSLTNDPGLHQLLPYFVQFVSDEVTHNLHNLPYLQILMRLVRSLLDSPYLHVDPYLHQLMPPLLTCLLGKSLCENPTENHWYLRDATAQIIAYICTRYGDLYKSLQPRVAKTLVQSLLDRTKPLTTHFGAIVGITALGAEMIQALLLPNIQNYVKYLEPELSSKDAVKKMEAKNCYSSLLRAASVYVHQVSMDYARSTPTEVLGKASVQVQYTSEDELEKMLFTDPIAAVQNPTSTFSNHKTVKYWDLLVELFGESVIPSQITQASLGKINLTV